MSLVVLQLSLVFLLLVVLRLMFLGGLEVSPQSRPGRSLFGWYRGHGLAVNGGVALAKTLKFGSDAFAMEL
jgi:hypothetical protein